MFIGSFCGSLSSIKASDLGSIVIKESLARAGLKPTDVSEVIVGQVIKNYNLVINRTTHLNDLTLKKNK